jgi:hypothetical protein
MTESKAQRIRTPGFKISDMTICEQVASGMFAVHEKMPDGSWRTVEVPEFPAGGKGVFVPMQRVLWPVASMPVDSVDEPALFNDLIEYFKRHEALRDLNAYEILAAWTFLTYRADFEFSITPYLNALGPRGTGKTRLLELLASVCYRGWLVTHPSPASVFYVVDRYAPTLLADNYEFWSKESRRELDGLFNAGYRTGAVVPRRPRDETGGNELEVYRVFCPKSISGTREPSEALASRCVLIRTARSSGPIPMFIDLDTAARLRAKLLAYRFKHFEAPLQRDESIQNSYWRVGEIFYPLLTVAPNEGAAQTIADFAKGIFSDDVEEAAQGFDADVVEAIHEAEPLALDGKLTIANILAAINKNRVDTEKKINSRGLGWALKRLGFKKTRLGDTAATRAIQLDRKLLEHLDRTYKPSLLSAVSANPAVSAIKVGVQADRQQATSIDQPKQPTSASNPPRTTETPEMTETPEPQTTKVQKHTGTGGT